MNTLRVGKDEFPLYSKWDEVSNAHYEVFARLKSLCGKDEMRLLRLLVYRWSGMSARLYMMMNKCQVTDVAQSLDWVLTEPYPSNNMIPEVHVNGTVLYGQGDDLRHVIVLEFMKTDTHLKDFVKNQSDEALDRLICFLYRPAGVIATRSGDKREDFDEYKCLDRLEIIKQIPSWIKLGIGLNYLGMRHKLTLDYKHVFEGGGSGRSFGIPGMIHDMAGAELGTVQDIERKWTIRNLCFIIQKNEIRRMEAKANKITE